LDYPGSIDRLLTLVDHERTTPAGPRQKVIYDLRRMEALLERLGQPQERARTVHIAGTKGKGSTAAFCDAALHASGYRTGFYSSPHLHSFRERIRRDTQPVTGPQFAGLVEQVWPQLEWVSERSGLGRVTLFEMLTGMGFHCFAREGVEFQTIEVGLGGRLDATNVVSPDVAVITSISHDHSAILGDSLAEIAGEKAGIIKPGAVVVVAPQSREALPVIDAVCRRMKARPVHVGADVTWEAGSADSEGQSLRIQGRLDDYELRIPLLGSYQMENAATAVAALEVLREQGHRIPVDAIRRGFTGTVWPCRMEVLSRSPLVVADGAHNLYSMDALLESLPRHFSYRRLVLVAGFSRDKSVAEMVRRLGAARPVVFATGSRHPRSLTPSAVAARFQLLGTAAVPVSNPEQALTEALNAAGPDDLVLATGSLFLAAEVREAMLGIEPELYPDLLPADQRVP
jgi:dihydrofolate synthase/folylpolyglutamate synthase